MKKTFFPSPQKIVIRTALVGLAALICLLSGCSEKERPKPKRAAVLSVDSAFNFVELDAFIAAEKQAVHSLKGRKLITMAAPVRFVAKMKRFPEEKPMTYVYTALEMARVSPLPDVGHQLFVESAGGEIISVYVERRAAAQLKQNLKVGETAQFMAYHLYSSAQGPALLVVDFLPESAPEANHE